MRLIKSVVILGSSGNCGKLTIDYFLKKKIKVYGVSRREVKRNDINYTHFIGDIQKSQTFESLPNNPDLIINYAGVQPSIMDTSESTNLLKTLETYVNVNIGGIINVLMYVKKCIGSTYIYTTTHREYENYWKDRLKIKNKMSQAINLKGDHTMYAISKYTGRLIGDYFSESFNVRVFNLRLPMIFLVPSQPYYLVNGEKKIMPFLKVIKDAIQGKDLEIWGDPNLPRDYVYFDNLINLIDGCFQSNLQKGTYNVGTGEAVSTEAFIKSIAKVFSKNYNEQQYVYKPKKWTYKSAVYDIQEQKIKLNYQPVLLNEMLLRMKKIIQEKNLIEKWEWNRI